MNNPSPNFVSPNGKHFDVDVIKIIDGKTIRERTNQSHFAPGSTIAVLNGPYENGTNREFYLYKRNF